MSVETVGVIQRELGLREQLLWSGVPRKGIIFRRSDLLIIPFFLVWGGIPLTGMISSIRAGNNLYAQILPFAFVLIALYMLIGRFFVEAWQRSKTYYGVTNERVIIVSHWFGKNLKSLNLQALNEMMVEEKADGSGTITFGHSLIQREEKVEHQSFKLSPASSAKSSSNGETGAPSLEMIPDVKAVFNLIRDAQRALERKPL